MPNGKEAACCRERRRVRDEDERRDLMNRLKRIEGQVRGLQRMLEEDAYCPEILTQASAVNSALNSFSACPRERPVKATQERSASPSFTSASSARLNPQAQAASAPKRRSE